MMAYKLRYQGELHDQKDHFRDTRTPKSMRIRWNWPRRSLRRGRRILIGASSKMNTK
jgi:hypothetical protein